jgi:pimeloyl-ACP methyl ester carboxylesterase
MRLIFVHGINQQGKSSEGLRDVWVADLEKGLGRPGALSGVEIAQPFYGDTLFQLAGTRPTGAIAQGASAAEDQELAQFLAEGLQEQAEAAGITGAEIRDEQEELAERGDAAVAVEQGFPMNRRINAIVGLLEKVSPLRGDLALRMLDQAHAYLKKVHVRQGVDAIVKPVLEKGPAVVVAHSLGTVVTFRLLRELAAAGKPVEVPLYVTVGSPLPIDAVRRAVGAPYSRPEGVKHWLNARDPDDFITLNRALDLPLFAGGIENIADVDNRGKDPHAIPGYLADSRVAKAIGDALGL